MMELLRREEYVDKHFVKCEFFYLNVVVLGRAGVIVA